MNQIGSSQERKYFIRKVMALVLPMALQNLINVGIQAADVLMLGNVSETVLSAASLAGQVYFILCLFIFGLTSGAAVLTAQYWGKRDFHSIETIMGIALQFCVGISFIFTVVTLAIPDVLMSIYTNDQEVIANGVIFLRIVAFCYIISCITMTYLNILRSIERVLVSTMVYSISLCVNISINFVLIFGLLGAPKMGIAGAAIGTLCARILELVIVILYTKKTRPPVHVSPRLLLAYDPVLFRDFIKYASPVIMNELLWGIAISTSAGILGHMGTSAVAANSIANVARQLAMVVAFGTANAAAIMVGKAIGEERYDLAKLYGRRFEKLSIGFGLLGSVVLLVSTPIIKIFMNLSPLASSYFTFMMIALAVNCVAQSYNTAMIVGVFRGGGDTKFGLFVDVATMWFWSLPASFLAAFVFHFPVSIVFMILISDEFAKITLTIVHFRKLKWLQNITR